VELFQSAGNYPSLTCFYQQRLCFAASRKQPQSVWMSRSNNFENFSNSVPVVDDGAIEITMAGSEVSMPYASRFFVYFSPLSGLTCTNSAPFS
jgi:hypothetical protein